MLYPSLLLYLATLFIRPGEIVPSWQGFPFIQILTGISLVVAVATQLVSPRRFANLPQDKCVLGFYAAAVVSNLAWGWLGGAYAAAYTLFPTVFCYFLLRLAVQTQRQLSWAISLVVVLTLFQAVNGIVQHNTGMGFGNVTTLEQAGTGVATVDAARIFDTDAQGATTLRIRGTGIFNDPNDLAMTLILAVPFVLGTALRRSERVGARLWSLAGLFCLLWAIYYTNSRGGIVGLGAVVVSMAYQRFKKRYAVAVAAIGLIALVLAGPSRINQIDSDGESAQGRMHAWSAGLGMLKERPVFGVGYSRFTEYNELVAHNSFVHVFAELGMVGAVFFVGIFYFFFKGLRDADDAHTRAPDLVASGIGLTACIFFLSRQYNVVPFTLLGLGAAQVGLSYPSTATAGRFGFDGGRILGLTLGGIFAMYVIVRAFTIW